MVDLPVERAVEFFESINSSPTDVRSGNGVRRQPQGRWRSGRVLRERPAATAPRLDPTSRADPQGSERPASLPARRRARLPDARPRGHVALRRRDPAHPARHPDRLAARRRALHPRRAEHRSAPARQRAAARHAARAARPRQHGHRRRARRGHDPRGRPRDRPRARARAASAARWSPRARSRRSAAIRLAHRPLSPGRAAGPGAGRAARGARQAPAPDRRRAGEQPAKPHGRHPARPVRRGHRRVGLGQVHAGHRHPLPGAGAPLLSRQGRARRAHADRGAGPDRQGHRHRPESRSAARRAPIRPPTPGSSRRSASCSPSCPTRRCAATGRAGSPST